MKQNEFNSDKIITTSFHGVTCRFSRAAFEGTTASPAFAAVSLPDGRELIYPMWNQGKLEFRYLRRSGAEYGLTHRKHFYNRHAGGGLVAPKEEHHQ